MVDIIVRDLTKAPNEADFLKFYTFKDEEWEKVSEVIKYIKDGAGKGLGLCDKCDYFVSVEEAYTNGKEDGKADAINECLQVLHNIYAQNEYCSNGCDKDGVGCDDCLYTCVKARLNELKEKNNDSDGNNN